MIGKIRDKKLVLMTAGAVAALAVILLVMHVVSTRAAGNGSMGIPIKPDYSLVPIYTMQGNQAYMNSHATPLLFVDRSDRSGKYAGAVQAMLQKLHPAKPLVMVSTDFSSPDLKSAEAVTAAWEKEYGLTLPVVLQAGDAQAYAPQVPMLLYYTVQNGKTVKNVLTVVPTKAQLLSICGTYAGPPSKEIVPTPAKK
ncbi:MAG: hypothetical protein M0Z41_05190 [Peptococcaceae bacterium]|nr:hypothetical protein [Peptococcaceae bacterium]